MWSRRELRNNLFTQNQNYSYQFPEMVQTKKTDEVLARFMNIQDNKWITGSPITEEVVSRIIKALNNEPYHIESDILSEHLCTDTFCIKDS